MASCPKTPVKARVYINRIEPGAQIVRCGKPGHQYYVALKGRRGANAIVDWDTTPTLAAEAQRRLDAAIKRGRW